MAMLWLLLLHFGPNGCFPALLRAINYSQPSHVQGVDGDTLVALLSQRGSQQLAAGMHLTLLMEMTDVNLRRYLTCPFFLCIYLCWLSSPVTFLSIPRR